jgi:hypothetical protein
VAISNDVSSTSIVDLVKMVCLQDFQETTPPPIVNTYPLVALISSALEIQFESLYPFKYPSVFDIMNHIVHCTL